jgi:Uma2 family endonuclease
VLVVEVAASSLTRDLREKPPIYARAGVPDYWVADLDGERVVTHASPSGGGYDHVEVVGSDGELQASRLEIPPIPVADLLAAAAR